MRLGEYLDRDYVISELASASKAEALRELVEAVGTKFPDLNVEAACNVLLERESLGSTGIGDGIAIPHGKLDNLDKIVVAVGRSASGVDFDALDNQPCQIFFLVLAPDQAAGLHLRILAHISRLLKDESFRTNFLSVDGQDGLWQLLQGA